MTRDLSYAFRMLIKSPAFTIVAVLGIGGSFAVVSYILLIVCLVACYVPARATMRLDPMQALRHE
jgi:ABC-type lipoprotein release transport system permease subunit